MPDPWKHQAMGMRCATCMWFVPKVVPILEVPIELGEGAQIVEANKSEIGRCRRHAPTMNGYPVVFQIDWCGDHKLDENKVK